MSFIQSDPAATGANWKHHTVLRVTTEDDENALHSLLPYLAMGFGMVETEGKEDHTSALHALRRSFNAAVKRLYGEKEETPDWRDYMKYKEYTRVVQDHVRSRKYPTAKKEKEKIDELMFLSPTQDLSSVQMVLLLDVANRDFKTRFQLGFIREGFTGRYDDNTGVYDGTYVQPTELVIVRGPLSNRPVLWIYTTNQDACNQAHRRTTKISENHFEGIATTNTSQLQYSAHMNRVEQLCVGEWLDNLFQKGVWRLSADQTAHGQLGCMMGSFVREVDTLVRDGDIYVCAANRSTGFVMHKYLAAIPKPLRDAPTTATDRKWEDQSKQFKIELNKEEAREKRQKMFAEDEIEDEEPLDVVEGLTRISLCRIIPASSNTGHFLDRTEIYPTSTIVNFNIGAIVLDSGHRELRKGTKIAEVTRANGEETQILLRCLQPLEHPFGLADSLPLMEPFGGVSESFTLAKLKELYKTKYHEEPARNEGVTRNELRKSQKNKFKEDPAKELNTRKKLLAYMNEKESQKRQYLRVFAVRKESSTRKSNSTVDFETGEYVLRQDTVGKGRYFRDHEGIEGTLNELDLAGSTKDENGVMGDAVGAWDLTLSSSIDLYVPKSR